MPQPHLVVQHLAAGNGAAAGLGAFLPVVHIILLKSSRRTEPANGGEPDLLFHLRRRGPVGESPRPDLDLARPFGVPDAKGAGAAPHDGKVGKDSANNRVQRPPQRPQTGVNLGPDPILILIQQLRRLPRLPGGHGNHPMPVGRGHRPAPHHRRRRDPHAEPGPNRRQVRPWHVIGIPGEIFRRHFPVARHHPLMDAANDLHAPLAPVKKRIQIPANRPQVFRQRRRRRVESGENQPLVAIQLRHRNQPPLLPVQFVIVGILQIRHRLKPPVSPVSPAVIGADERRRVAVIRPAQPVAPMPADVQKSPHAAPPVPRHQHRILPHISGDKIPGPRNLTLMPQEQPAPGKDPLQLLLINLDIAENPRANQPTLNIHQRGNIANHACASGEDDGRIVARPRGAGKGGAPHRHSRESGNPRTPDRQGTPSPANSPHRPSPPKPPANANFPHRPSPKKTPTNPPIPRTHPHALSLP